MMYIKGKRCVYQSKGIKGYFCRCLKDGSLRKDLCWYRCPKFKPTLWHKFKAVIK
jgi:hypothetical protein